MSTGKVLGSVVAAGVVLGVADKYLNKKKRKKIKASKNVRLV